MKNLCLPALYVCVALSVLGCAEHNEPKTAEAPTPPRITIEPVTHRAPPAWKPSIAAPIDFKKMETALAKSYTYSPEDNPGVWSIHGNSCSWYCGGETENVIASSRLYEQHGFTYGPNNAHDLGYDTAWVEGVEGPGIGELLIYTFTNKCPRITKVHILNGYIKNKSVWTKNNRVKDLEFSVNGKPTAILKLADTRGEQSFDFKKLGLPPLGRTRDGKPLTLTFKILSVYPGTEYDDTAITEIYFDGIDVH